MTKLGGSGNDKDLAPSLLGVARKPRFKSPQLSTQICQPPTMMECKLRVGSCTSRVEINLGNYGMWATGRGLHINGGD